jgi:hypothetical protein
MPDTVVQTKQEKFNGQRKRGQSRTFSASLITHRFEDRGPTISWHDSQKLLFHAVGDVLLILDTCNAAMIAKGTKPSGRFEMIAASAKGFKTPVPGRSSFTKLLTEELRRQSQSGVSVLHLCSLLLENDRITGKSTDSFKRDFALTCI